MKNVVTSKEQSRRLIKAGVPLSLSDGYYDYFGELKDGGGLTEDFYKCMSSEVLPAWTLSYLLSILPTTFSGNHRNEKVLQITPNITEEGWNIGYFGTNFWVSDKDLLEAAIKLIEVLPKKMKKFNLNIRTV